MALTKRPPRRVIYGWARGVDLSGVAYGKNRVRVSGIWEDVLWVEQEFESTVPFAVMRDGSIRSGKSFVIDTWDCNTMTNYVVAGNWLPYIKGDAVPAKQVG